MPGLSPPQGLQADLQNSPADALRCPVLTEWIWIEIFNQISWISWGAVSSRKNLACKVRLVPNSDFDPCRMPKKNQQASHFRRLSKLETRQISLIPIDIDPVESNRCINLFAQGVSLSQGVNCKIWPSLYLDTSNSGTVLMQIWIVQPSYFCIHTNPSIFGKNWWRTKSWRTLPLYASFQKVPCTILTVK